MDNFEYKDLDEEGQQTLQVIAEADKFNEWMFSTIAPWCQGKILEIGSGIGNISSYFLKQKSHIVLSDIRTTYCDFLENKFQLPADRLLRNLDLTDPQLTDKYGHELGTYDSVFALNVVEHIKNDSLAIANCARFLRPGGTLVILVPAYNALYNTFDKELGHYRRYTRKSLSTIFESGGFEIRKSQYFNLAGIAGWFVSGKFQRNKTIPAGQMKLYNKLVPLFKVADKVFFNQVGLSVIVIGHKK